MTGYSFENVPQLHRHSPNWMKLSGFVELVNVSIAGDLKIFKSLAKGSEREGNLGSRSQNLISGISPFEMIES
jgi:hypothetical protein